MNDNEELVPLGRRRTFRSKHRLVRGLFELPLLWFAPDPDQKSCRLYQCPRLSAIRVCRSWFRRSAWHERSAFPAERARCNNEKVQLLKKPKKKRRIVCPIFLKFFSL